jgi:hypothetical protein
MPVKTAHKGRGVRDKTKKKMPARIKKTERLNLLIRADLKGWVHKYADRMDKSVSSIVTEHFIELRERERREKIHGVEVEQI